MYGWEGQHVAPRLGRGGGNPGGRACNSGHNRLCYNELMSYNEPMSVLPPFLLCKTFFKLFSFFNLNFKVFYKTNKKKKNFLMVKKHFKKTFFFAAVVRSTFAKF